MIRQFLSLFLVAAGVLPADAATKPDIVVDQAIVVMRHGIRAPLDGEVPEGTRTAQPWPRWPVAESPITPHGHRALERVAAADRRRFIRQGLIPARGCPAPAAVTIRSNNSARTIASGDDYAAALLPGCPGTVVHLPAGSADPIFEPLRAGATRFDAAAAIDSIERSTGGVAALAARHRAALALLDGVLACAPRGDGCAPPRPSRVAASADGKGVDLDGPIRTTSGIAQVLLLQYVEGMPRRAVGWGRVDAASLRRMGALHAALFDVFTRPPTWPRIRHRHWGETFWIRSRAGRGCAF
ncbi:histidine-type phosphatase [Sphingomonas hankookensis]|uniref:histidine-type phosphatase n=1 Tax=Sphingomonas hankookensis TaxID=563996 RepID=UPI003D3022F6